MSQQTINVGTTANDGTGDALRNAFIKANDNFTELYTNRISGSGTDNYIPRFNGTNALENSIIFDNGTNVGIGTSSPSNSKLVVSGASASGGIMSVDTSSTTSFVRILGDIASQNLINWQDGTSLRFATSTQAFGSFAERMRINSLGEILVGQTSAIYSATNRANLTIGNSAGSMIVLGTSTASNGYLFYNNTDIELSNSTASGSVFFRTAGTERMRITSGGNVGIGTATADYRTQIETTSANVFLVKNTSSTSFNRSYFHNNNNIGTQFLNFGSAYGFGTEFGVGQNGSVLQSNTTSAFAIGTSTSTPLYLGTNGTERMRITSSGNVYIGKTSGSSKFGISGLPTSSAGLSSGDIWNDGGTLKIV